jgi:hypothetical protein
MKPRVAKIAEVVHSKSKIEFFITKILLMNILMDFQTFELIPPLQFGLLVKKRNIRMNTLE